MPDPRRSSATCELGGLGSSGDKVTPTVEAPRLKEGLGGCHPVGSGSVVDRSPLPTMAHTSGVPSQVASLVGPRPGDRIGQADLGGGGVHAAGAGMGGGEPGGGEPGGGDLRVGEHHPENAVIGGSARAAEDVGDDAAW